MEWDQCYQYKLYTGKSKCVDEKTTIVLNKWLKQRKLCLVPHKYLTGIKHLHYYRKFPLYFSAIHWDCLQYLWALGYLLRSLLDRQVRNNDLLQIPFSRWERLWVVLKLLPYFCPIMQLAHLNCKDFKRVKLVWKPTLKTYQLRIFYQWNRTISLQWSQKPQSLKITYRSPWMERWLIKSYQIIELLLWLSWLAKQWCHSSCCLSNRWKLRYQLLSLKLQIQRKTRCLSQSPMFQLAIQSFLLLFP